MRPLSERDTANLTNAAYSRDVDEADARFDEINSMLVPTAQYLNGTAQAEHDDQIALAQASAAETAAEAVG